MRRQKLIPEKPNARVNIAWQGFQSKKQQQKNKRYFSRTSARVGPTHPYLPLLGSHPPLISTVQNLRTAHLLLHD